MITRDKVELSLIAVAVAVVGTLPYLPASPLPDHVALGELALLGSGMLFLQGLTRDLWIKYREPVVVEATEGGGGITCMCVESTVGVVGVVAGGVLMLAGSARSLAIARGFWWTFLAIVLVAGFAMKSLVFDWRSRRVRWVSDHRTIRVG